MPTIRSVAALATAFAFLAGNAGASGQLDPAFGNGGFVTTEFHHGSDEIFGLAVQPDGRILATGRTNGVLNGLALARYTTDGDLDPTFGDGGAVLNGTIRKGLAIALQSDGKIVVVAEGSSPDFVVFRFDGDGDPDPGFGTGGQVTTNFGPGSNEQANAVVVQSDGRIVVGGYSGADFDPANAALARYLADGTLDPSFGTGGLVTTDFGAVSAEIRALALQSDGKIVAAGRVGDDFLVLRYLADGTLDPGFGTGGIAITDFAGDFDYARGLALQSDGRIVVAGYTTTGGVDNDFALARYDADGALDATFGTGGLVTTDLGGTGSGDFGHAVALQANGRIVVSGDSGDSFGLARYDTDGGLDASFGGGGIVVAAFPNSRSRAVAVDPSGGIVAGGFVDSRFGVARFLVDGSLDASFGSAGLALQEIGISADVAGSVALQPDGKIVILGTAAGIAQGDFALARYGPNGQPDPTFGSSGRVITRLATGLPTQGIAVAIRPDGKIVAGGFTDVFNNPSHVALTRHLSDGSLDPTFGDGGRVISDLGASDRVEDLALQSDGRIVVASWRSGSKFVVARYTSAGDLDPTFGTGGVALISVGQAAHTRALVVQPDDKILVTGNISIGFAVVARLNADGSPDTSFGIGGVSSTQPIPLDLSPVDVALQADGRIVTVAQTAQGLALLRYHPDGSLDTGFGSGWEVVTNTPERVFPYAVIVQPGGLITVAGTTRLDPNATDVVLVRYDSDGELDPTFGTGGITVSDFGDPREEAHDLVFQPPARLVVAGISAYDFLLAGYTAGVDSAVFADGFESGDTSAWSATVP